MLSFSRGVCTWRSRIRESSPDNPRRKILQKFASIRHHRSPVNNQQSGVSKNTSPEQLGLEAPPVRKTEGALSVALVEVPFRGAPLELVTLAVLVRWIAGAEVDVAVSAVAGPRKFEGKGFVTIDITISEYVAIITDSIDLLIPAPPSPSPPLP
jgi:hypothetical protein